MTFSLSLQYLKDHKDKIKKGKSQVLFSLPFVINLWFISQARETTQV